MDAIVDDIELDNNVHNSIIKLRFLEQIRYYEKKRDRTGCFYNIFRFTVTFGSIVLPALLSIGQMDPEKLPRNFDQISYWMTWMISLIVTMSNGFLQLFSLDKNYFNYSVVVEQLKTEGWQFFSLSGKYSDFDTHQEAYKVFLKYIEGIKRKQVEQEFSSSKGDKKKKEFDFKKEMFKFQNQAIISGTGQSVNTLPLLQKNNVSIDQNLSKNINNTTDDISNSLINKVMNTVSMNENITDTLTNKVSNTFDNTVNETLNNVNRNLNTNLDNVIENNDNQNVSYNVVQYGDTGNKKVINQKPPPPPPPKK